MTGTADIVLKMFISPVFTVWELWKNASFKRKHWILTIFATFYGSTITLGYSSDISKHIRFSDVYTDMNLKEFITGFYYILTFKPLTSAQEPYIHILFYLTRAVFNSANLLVIINFFIYGYFYTGSLLKSIKLVKGVKYNYFIYIFLLSAVLWVGPSEGVGARIWTGMWILVYACLNYYESKKKKYIILMLITPLIHVGFYIIVIPGIIVLIAGNREYIYIAVFVLSFLTNIDKVTVISKLETTELGESKVKGYYREEESTINDKLESGKDRGFSLHNNLGRAGYHNLAIQILAFSFIFTGMYNNKFTKLEKSLFSIGILTFALGNFTYFISELSARSKITAGEFIIIVLMLLLGRGYFSKNYFNKNKKLKIIFISAVILFTPFLLYKLASNIYYFSFFNFIFPFIPWLYPDLNFSIRDLLGYIIKN